MTERTTTKRNDAYDLIRATGAVLVFFNHASHDFAASWLGPLALGGWNGVYIFFALSGFLLYGPFTTGPVSLRRYWTARLARILPAYYLCWGVLAVTGVAWSSGTNVWPVLTFTSNIFNEGAAFGWFGHSWTLGVEMSFYLVLPLIAAWARPKGTRLALIGAASLLVYLVVPGLWPRFQLPVEIWAFIGGMLAARYRDRLAIVARWWPAGMVLVVAGVLIVGAFGNTTGPVFTVLGTAVLLIAGHHRRPSIPWARWPADISYGFYLWHVPVLFATFGVGLRDWSLIIVAGALTTVAASLSWHFLERPILRASLRHQVRDAGLAVRPARVRAGVEQGPFVA